MGFWQLNNGVMVEMIFDEEGKFVKFGDDVTEENAEKVKKEIMRENNKQRNHTLLVDMIDEGISVDDIAEKCGENSCVSEYGLKVPNWCHEDADCHDCWIKYLKEEFKI